MNRDKRLNQLNQSVRNLNVTLAEAIGNKQPFKPEQLNLQKVADAEVIARAIWQIGNDLKQDLNTYGHQLSLNSRVEIRASLDHAKQFMIPLGFDCWNRDA